MNAGIKIVLQINPKKSLVTIKNHKIHRNYGHSEQQPAESINSHKKSFNYLIINTIGMFNMFKEIKHKGD